MSHHLSGPTANPGPIRCPPWCRPRVPEDRDDEQRWVILAGAGGVRPSSPLEADSFAKVILHFYGTRRSFTYYTLEAGVEEGNVVVQYDSVQQCWKQLGLPSGSPNRTVAYSTQAFLTPVSATSHEAMTPDPSMLDAATRAAQRKVLHAGLPLGPTEEEYCRTHGVVVVNQFRPRCSIVSNRAPYVSTADFRFSEPDESSAMDNDSKAPSRAQPVQDAQDIKIVENIQEIKPTADDVKLPREEADGATKWGNRPRKRKALHESGEARSESSSTAPPEPKRDSESKKQVRFKEETPASGKGTLKSVTSPVAPVEHLHSSKNKRQRKVGRTKKEGSSPGMTTTNENSPAGAPTQQPTINVNSKQNSGDEMDLDGVPEAEEKEHPTSGDVQEWEDMVHSNWNVAADTAVTAADEQKKSGTWGCTRDAAIKGNNMTVFFRM
ncbi:MAG: hypothetical protein L6R36_001965 [Xanthoria steineri]|nr:MAG: hypothetical protein L6R36_001965 [Xanthoria steineri]